MVHKYVCISALCTLIHLYFPEFELLFKNGKIYELTALNFIKEFLHAYIIKNKRVDALAYNMANTNQRHINYYKRKASVIKEYAKNSYPGVNENYMDVISLRNYIINCVVFIMRIRFYLKFVPC